MWVCSCNGVTDKEIREAAEAGISWRQFCQESKLGTDCGGCVKLALPMFKQSTASAGAARHVLSDEITELDTETEELAAGTRAQSRFTRTLIAVARRFRR